MFKRLTLRDWKRCRELVNINLSSIAQSASTFLPANTVNL